MNPSLSELNRTTLIHLPVPWNERSPSGTHSFPPLSVEYKYVPPLFSCQVISHPRFWLRKKRSRTCASSFGGVVLDSCQSLPPSTVWKTKNSLPLVPASNSSLIWGDLSAFHIRCSRATLQRAINAANTIEYGKVLYIARIRMDSALFDPSGGSAPPLVNATITA